MAHKIKDNILSISEVSIANTTTKKVIAAHEGEFANIDWLDICRCTTKYNNALCLAYLPQSIKNVFILSSNVDIRCGEHAQYMEQIHICDSFVREGVGILTSPHAVFTRIQDSRIESVHLYRTYGGCFCIVKGSFDSVAFKASARWENDAFEEEYYIPERYVNTSRCISESSFYNSHFCDGAFYKQHFHNCVFFGCFFFNKSFIECEFENCYIHHANGLETPFINCKGIVFINGKATDLENLPQNA